MPFATKYFCALFLATFSSSSFAQPAAPALSNGDFEAGARDWAVQDGFTIETEDNNRFGRLRATAPGKMLMVYRAVDLKPEHKNIEMKLRLRYTDVKAGAQNWNDARLIFHFKNANKEQINPDPAPVYFLGSSNGWVEHTIKFQVPEGATMLEVMPSLFQVESGTLDIDDLRFVAAAAPVAGNPTPKVNDDSEAAAYAPPPELRVAGPQVLARGKAVWLQGVNVPSLEWMPEGDHVLQSVREATTNWKSSVIRLPVNDVYWFGRGERQDGKSEKYRALVDSCIRAAARRGAYVVLDLHKYRAIRTEHLDFWREAATKYKNDPAVLFDIINEPHDISWAVWKNGGLVTEKPAQDGKPAVTYQSPGMQKAIDAIRATGARNIIVAGGLDWAYDLSAILTGSALDDRGGNGIIYGSHIYPWKKDWQNKVLAVAAKHPILLGEVGVDPRPVGDNPNESGYTWAPDMLGTIQKHKLHWTAWSFHIDATPRVLQDWDYNPTPFWGAWVRAALLGAKFEANRLR